jgi:hypothetical protein
MQSKGMEHQESDEYKQLYSQDLKLRNQAAHYQ